MLKTFLLLLPKFSFTRLYNSLCLRFSYLISVIFSRSFLCGLPEAISYEISSICNLNCLECPVGNGTIKRKQKFPDKFVYKKILNEVGDKLWHILLYFQGEPFINPQWSFFVKEANKHNIYTAISTNGHFLDDKNVKLILDSGLDEIIISVDGVTQEEYEKYRKGGNLNIVLEGIKRLAKEKKEAKKIKPIITLQFIVFSHNEMGLKNFKLIAKQLGADKIEIKTAQLENLNHIELLPHNEKYRRYKIENNKAVLKKKLKNKCWRMWHSFVITSDSNVVPCCFDKHETFNMGSLDKLNVLQIWKSNKYKEFRNLIFTNRTSVEMCRNCVE